MYISVSPSISTWEDLTDPPTTGAKKVGFRTGRKSLSSSAMSPVSKVADATVEPPGLTPVPSMSSWPWGMPQSWLSWIRTVYVL